MTDIEETNRRLMFHGMCLFVLGLLTGFAEQRFANVRMGLAAHLEGLMNGTFLIALGAIWIHVRLSREQRRSHSGLRCLAHMSTGSSPC